LPTNSEFSQKKYPFVGVVGQSEDGTEKLGIAKVNIYTCKAEEAAEHMLIAGEEIEKGFIVIKGKWMQQWGALGTQPLHDGARRRGGDSTSPT